MVPEFKSIQTIFDGLSNPLHIREVESDEVEIRNFDEVFILTLKHLLVDPRVDRNALNIPLPISPKTHDAFGVFTFDDSLFAKILKERVMEIWQCEKEPQTTCEKDETSFTYQVDGSDKSAKFIFEVRF